MDYVGNWQFHSIGTFGDEGMEYLDAQAYLDSAMPYVDESDPEAVAEEMDERRKMIRTRVKVCPDGLLYLMMPIPEGVPQEEVDAAVAAGEIKVMDGMLYDNALNWEDRDGEFWVCMGDDEASWGKAVDGEGYLNLLNLRFVKA